MKNKIALVTGGMGGIGTAICKALSTQGATVITTFHRPVEQAKKWQKDLAEEGFKIEIIHADVSDYPSCVAMAEMLYKTHDKVDILVNNAGITRDVQFCKMAPEQWHEVMKTNLDSMFNVTRQLINKMIDNRYGRIINIASINGSKGQFGQTNYSAAKAGVHGFSKALALEVARKGVTVNTVSPGYIATEMIMNIPDEYRQKTIDQIPVARLGQPDEIAEVVVYLAQEGSSFITGSNISINGGQYML